jgi:hypothetical protein
MLDIYGPAAGHWCPMRPHDVRASLVELNLPWWVAGGWMPLYDALSVVDPQHVWLTELRT